MITSILTVCVGNICRSPMAEVLLREQIPNVQVASAGIGALVGHGADEIAIQLMQSKDLDLTKHRAQQLNLSMCQRSEIILVMENSHKNFIHEKYPFTRGKVFRLGEHESIDIPDPYRRPREAFQHALDLISKGVDAWSKSIARI